MVKSSPDIIGTTTEFLSDFSEQLYENQRSPRNITILQMHEDGTLHKPEYPSVKVPLITRPHMLHLNVSANEADGVVWHLIENEETSKRWDVDFNGAIELVMDGQGRLLYTHECDDETYQELAQLVCDMLEHPVTIETLTELSEQVNNKELVALRGKLDGKGERRTAKEDELYRDLLALGKLSIASVHQYGKIGLVDRKVYNGRTSTNAGILAEPAEL